MKVLIIEDKEEYLRGAQKLFDTRPDIEVVVARNFAEAHEHLEPGKVDGVISDIFFPYHHRYANYTCDEKEIGACGVAVMMLCWERVIPCVMITDGHHHGPGLQWICSLQRGLDLPDMIDESSRYPDGKLPRLGTKNWTKALWLLEEQIRLGPCTVHNRYDWNVCRETAESPLYRSCK